MLQVVLRFICIEITFLISFEVAVFDGQHFMGFLLDYDDRWKDIIKSELQMW